MAQSSNALIKRLAIKLNYFKTNYFLKVAIKRLNRLEDIVLLFIELLF